MAAADQGFAFINADAFSATGMAEVRYIASGGKTFVRADLNGRACIQSR